MSYFPAPGTVKWRDPNADDKTAHCGHYFHFSQYNVNIICTTLHRVPCPCPTDTAAARLQPSTTCSLLTISIACLLTITLRGLTYLSSLHKCTPINIATSIVPSLHSLVRTDKCSCPQMFTKQNGKFYQLEQGGSRPHLPSPSSGVRPGHSGTGQTGCWTQLSSGSDAI